MADVPKVQPPPAGPAMPVAGLDNAPGVDESGGLDVAALAALEEATRAIAGVLDLEQVLQLIVDRVRDLASARYAALGIVGPSGRIERFITSGIGDLERHRIGPLPRGRGLLGLIIREATTIRVPVIADHPASSGFPSNHPPMTSFLGVPVTAHGVPIGNLYLTDKQTAPEFSAIDERLTELFAVHAGIAIESARLHTQAGQLAIIEERARIGRELHDGIIQSLYAVSLQLEDVPEILAESPAEGEARIDRAIDSLQRSIREIRNFIYGLQPEALDGHDIAAGLAGLVEEFRYNTLVEAELAVDAEAIDRIDDATGGEVLQLVREALSNAARHAGASRVRVTLEPATAGAVVIVADDGRGFDPDAVERRGRRGLSNMQARAEAVGGRLQIASRPGLGTRIIVLLPQPAGEATTAR